MMPLLSEPCIYCFYVKAWRKVTVRERKINKQLLSMATTSPQEIKTNYLLLK